MARTKREPQRSRTGWAAYYWRRYVTLGLPSSLHMAIWYDLLAEEFGP